MGIVYHPTSFIDRLERSRHDRAYEAEFLRDLVTAMHLCIALVTVHELLQCSLLGPI